MLFGKYPQYDHLRAFGFLCYMTTPKQGRDKLQDMVVPYVFMGYPHGKKEYKLMTLDDHKFHISRDVVFHEDNFPFSQHQDSALSLPIPPSAFTNDYMPSHTTTTPGFDPTDIPANHQPNTSTTSPRRVHKPPTYLQDYVCSSISTQTNYCIATSTNLCLQPPIISSSCLSAHNQHLLTNLHYTEPTCYEEAILHQVGKKPYIRNFRHYLTIIFGIFSPCHQERNPYSVNRPTGSSSSQMVQFERLKARLVIKGFT